MSDPLPSWDLVPADRDFYLSITARTDEAILGVKAMAFAVAKLGAEIEESYRQALSRDPGLTYAWEGALDREPDIGWLDVAMDRRRYWLPSPWAPHRTFRARIGTAEPCE